jgi:quinol monooxygenase YgiN
MIIVQGSARVDPAHVAELQAAAATMMAATRKETGCLHYSLAIEDAAAGVLSISERWTDAAALKAHFTEPHMAAFQKAIAGKVSNLDVNMYDASGERGLGL